MGGRAGALPRRYHVLALSTLAGIATLLAMRPGTSRCRSSAQRPRRRDPGPARLSRPAARRRHAAPGRGGAVDRTPGIVLARYRQAQADVAADDGPLPRPARRRSPRVHAGRSGARSHRLLERGTSGTSVASRPIPGRFPESARLPSVPAAGDRPAAIAVRLPAERRWPAALRGRSMAVGVTRVTLHREDERGSWQGSAWSSGWSSCSSSCRSGGRSVELYTDWLWFDEVGFSRVFSTILWTKIAPGRGRRRPGVPGALPQSSGDAPGPRAAGRARGEDDLPQLPSWRQVEPLYRRFLLPGCFVIAFMLSGQGTALWETMIRFRNAGALRRDRASLRP